MTKELEALAPIRNNHYMQRPVRSERRLQRIERRRRGEAQLPKRRWKRGHGQHAKSLLPSKLWSPFDKDGNIDTPRLAREGWHRAGALREPFYDQLPESTPLDIKSWFGES